MDHNKEFDGIYQSDNPLPGWWTGILWLSVLFSIGYAIYFPMSEWPMEKSFLNEVKEHNQKYPQAKVAAGGDLRGKPEAIAEGKKVYGQACAACHGQDAKGLIGPSLVDAEWLHGDNDKAVHDVVMKGVDASKAKTGKGAMPAHEGSLGSEKTYQIIAWIASVNPSLKPAGSGSSSSPGPAVAGGNPLRGNTDAIADGQKIYGQSCAMCHGQKGEGLVGPSLIDDKWLHGNTDAAMAEAILKGIDASKAKSGKGPMPAQEGALGAEKVNKVLAWMASVNPTLKAGADSGVSDVKVAETGGNPLRDKAEAIAEGKKLYGTFCAACHGQKAEGVIGPSLMDDKWLHGDTDTAMTEAILKGIDASKAKSGKGPMPAQEAVGAEKINKILAWIASENKTLKRK